MSFITWGERGVTVTVKHKLEKRFHTEYLTPKIYTWKYNGGPERGIREFYMKGIHGSSKIQLVF